MYTKTWPCCERNIKNLAKPRCMLRGSYLFELSVFWWSITIWARIKLFSWKKKKKKNHSGLVSFESNFTIFLTSDRRGQIRYWKTVANLLLIFKIFLPKIQHLKNSLLNVIIYIGINVCVSMYALTKDI